VRQKKQSVKEFSLLNLWTTIFCIDFRRKKIGMALALFSDENATGFNFLLERRTK